MDVDNEGYPIADAINLDNYTRYKPPKKAKDTQGLAGLANYYKKHGDDVKDHFFIARKAGQQHGIARRIAKKRIKKFEVESNPVIILNLKTKRPKRKPVDQLYWVKSTKSI